MGFKRGHINENDVYRALSERLKLAAIRPNIAGYQPHPKQLRFHQSQRRHRLFIGGNRSGKTVSGTTEGVWHATGTHPYRAEANYPAHNGGSRGRVVGVDFKEGLGQILLPSYAQWLPPSALIGGSWEDSYAKQPRVLTLTNGSTIEFMSYEQQVGAFAGTSRHWVHFDEEPPQAIYIECRARLVDTGGSWWMTLTPVEGMIWMYDEIYIEGKTNPLSDIEVIEVRMSENPYIKDTEVEAFASSLKGDEKLTRIRGKFIRRGGLVFPNFGEHNVINAMIPDKKWEWYASLDHGFNNPTAWLWHAVSPDNIVITFSEHYQREMVVKDHALVVHARNAIFERVPDLYVGDPACAQRSGVTGTSIFQEYIDYGIPILPGNNDVNTGVNRINDYLQMRGSDRKPRYFITANCINYLEEIKKLRWKTWSNSKQRSENNPQEQIHKKDDHACDSARYFFTLLPDLTPNLPEGTVRIRSNPLGAQTGAAVAGSFDQLARVSQPNPSNEWTVESTDEYVGYY